MLGVLLTAGLQYDLESKGIGVSTAVVVALAVLHVWFMDALSMSLFVAVCWIPIARSTSTVISPVFVFCNESYSESLARPWIAPV